MKSLVAFVAGVIFALGLAVSGMTQPHKVIAFLDFSGDWDPSLMFVMIGAIVVHAASIRLIRLRKKPILDAEFHEPRDKSISKSLAAGALIFGVGWGLGGYCPGPAIASLGTLSARPIIFVVSMMIGMIAFRFAQKKARL